VKIMNRKINIVAITLTAGIIALTAISTPVSAHESREDHRQTLMQKLVERFNLNLDEVKTFFEGIRQERQAERQAKFEEKLTSEVEAGNITEDQKTLIQQKHEELKADKEAKREEFQNLTREERREKMRQHREEMREWAEANGIDLKHLMGPGKEGYGPRDGQRPKEDTRPVQNGQNSQN
jgi:polyhydroxyalkanoate synthesis regulator phasin